MATSILTWPPALIQFFNCFYGVWDPSNQLEAELASNLPREMCKMVEYETGFDNFRFLTWPPAPGHGEYIYIYIWRMDRSEYWILPAQLHQRWKSYFAGPKSRKSKWMRPYLGEWISPNIEFCRPSSTSVEKVILLAQSQGNQNGCGRIYFVSMFPRN